MLVTIEPKAGTRPVGPNARAVIEARYARKDVAGRPVEDWEAVVARVVAFVARAEPDEASRREFVARAYDLIASRRFIPNTPCLVNAGRSDRPGSNMLAACFVVPVEDSIESIMHHAGVCAAIHQKGGGTGQSYERLRPAGASVGGGFGTASGPVSFMSVVNTTTEAIKQAGVRRGANMGILSCTHPDILRFIHAKNDQTSLTNFNISVSVTDAFMRAVEAGEWFQLSFEGRAWSEPIHDPKASEGKGGPYQWRGERRLGQVFAPDVWRRIMESAHRWAEPGVVFIDTINRTGNTLRDTLGEMIATNPCAEQPLHAWNSCNLGSIDVAKYVRDRAVDWDLLGTDVATAVRFLDNVVDAGDWPLPEIAAMVARTRPVGLGLMGVADLLVHLHVKYGSDESLAVVEELFAFVNRRAWEASCALGAERGVVPEFEGNRRLFEEHVYGFAGVSRDVPLTPRNYEVTTCAPTGTISLVAETSSGLEPNFAWAYVRRDTVGERTYAHPAAAEALGVRLDRDDPESVRAAANEIVARRAQLPAWFVDAHELTAHDHLRVLAAAQRHVDAAISKTINAPATATVEETDQVHRAAWRAGVKAVSYYRDGSRDNQVLTAAAATPSATTVVSAEPSPAATVVSAEPSRVRIERPKELSGWTWRAPFDSANLYVTVNHDGRQVVEVFCRGPLSDSVGMLASQMLRGGFRVGEVVRSLEKVIGLHSVWFNEKLCSSPEQALAECLRIAERRLSGLADSGREAAFSRTIGSVRCPECGGDAHLQGGCLTCPACGFSRCG